MITLVSGKQNSGKSAFAERLATKSDLPCRYYIATMRVVDEDSMERRKKHRQMREGLGFETLEIPCLIDSAPDLMRSPEKCVVLLECVANLVANIMHEPEWTGRLTVADSESGDEFVRYVTQLIKDLAGSVGHLIVVTSEYDKEGAEGASLYIDLLDAVNARLNRIADKVYTIENGQQV